MGSTVPVVFGMLSRTYIVPLSVVRKLPFSSVLRTTISCCSAWKLKWLKIVEYEKIVWECKIRTFEEEFCNHGINN